MPALSRVCPAPRPAPRSDAGVIRSPGCTLVTMVMSRPAQMWSPRVNRVVTGFDAQGNPAVIASGEPPTVIHAGRYTTTELWVSGRGPITAGNADTSAQEWALEPPAGGACFRIVQIAPGAADGG